jgi:steroid delta-isomerase-like uncharacterized protein
MSNVDRHRAAHDAFNAGDMQGAAAHFGEDCTCTDIPRGLTMKTRAEFVDWLTSWHVGLPDGQVTERSYIDGGDTTVCRFVGAGTHTGQLGPYPATGRRLSVPYCEVIHWGADGQAKWLETYYDQVTIGVQLGFVEPPPAG